MVKPANIHYFDFDARNSCVTVPQYAPNLEEMVPAKPKKKPVDKLAKMLKGLNV